MTTGAVVETPVEAASDNPDWLPEVRLFRLSVDQYFAMVDAGILGKYDKVELIEGILVEKMTKDDPHVTAGDLINRIFNRIVPDDWFVSIERPVGTQTSVPEPDVAIVQGSPRDYLGRKAPLTAMGLVVEISDSSLRYDRRTKLRIYARAGIVRYWIVNLNDRQIEVYTQPDTSGNQPTYLEQKVYDENDRIPLVLDDKEITQITVSDLLP